LKATENIKLYEELYDLYELLHPDRDTECAFYRSLIKAAGQRAIDVACGSGVISGELFAAGADVTGLDGSEKMLSLARARLPEATWIHGDMRDFNLHTRFDLAVLACNSLQHMVTPDNAVAALACIERHLAPGAQFAFDVFNPSQDYLAGPRRDILLREVIAPDGRRIQLFEDTDYDAQTRLLYIKWRIVDVLEKRTLRFATATMQQFPPTVLDRLVARAGLQIREKFGDFDCGQFSSEALKQIVIAKRPA